MSSTDVRTVAERFFLLPRRALAVGSAALVAVALMAFAVPMEPLSVDRRWSDAMASIEAHALTDIALVFNALGRGFGFALTLVVVSGVLLVRRRFVALVAFLVAYAAVTCIALVLLFAPPRRRGCWWGLAAFGVTGMAWSRTYLQVTGFPT